MNKSRSKTRMLTRFLKDIDESLVKLNQNLDKLIDGIKHSKKERQSKKADFASFSGPQTIESLLQATRIEDQKRCRSSTV